MALGCPKGLRWKVLCGGLAVAVTHAVCIFPQSCQTGNGQCSQISQISVNGWVKKQRSGAQRVCLSVCLLEGLPKKICNYLVLHSKLKGTIYLLQLAKLRIMEEEMLFSSLLFIFFHQMTCQKEHYFKAQKHVA